MSTQQVISVICPNCQTQFSAPVYTLIDGQDLVLKYELLQRRLNLVQCPRCGLVQPATVPFLYYDLEKELAFVLSPDHLSLTGGDSQKIIGNLTNRLLNSLPAEQRKFYLFNPKQFLTLDNMVKAILEADGITEEMMKTQESKSKLIQELLSITDKTALKAKIEEIDDQLDRDFFEVLTAAIQAAHINGDTEMAQVLLGLRSITANLSSRGKEIVKDIDSNLQAVFLESREDLLEQLRTAKSDEVFDELVAAGYDMLDYGFFQQLTEQIDEATRNNDSLKATELSNLRTRILEAKDRLDAQARAEMQQAADLLTEVVKLGNPQQALSKKLDKITPAFFAVLRANIEEARKNNAAEVAQVLTSIGNLASALLREAEIQRLKQQQDNEEITTESAPTAPTIEIARK